MVNLFINRPTILELFVRARIYHILTYIKQTFEWQCIFSEDV